MVQFATSTLADLTNYPVTAGTITASDNENFRNAVETAIINLNDAAQALASFQAGSAASESLRGSVWGDTSNASRAIWKGDPDGLGPDDEFLTRLEAYRISLATGGTATFKPSGIINVNTTSVSLSATTSATLQVYSVPANTLDANGKFLHVIAFGTKSGANAGMSLVPQLGAGVVTTHTSSTNITDWCIEFWIVRTGVGGQDCGSYIIYNRDDTTSTTLCDFASLTQDETAALNISIKCGSKHTSDVVSSEIMIVEYGGGS